MSDRRRCPGRSRRPSTARPDCCGCRRITCRSANWTRVVVPGLDDDRDIPMRQFGVRAGRWPGTASSPVPWACDRPARTGRRTTTPRRRPRSTDCLRAAARRGCRSRREGTRHHGLRRLPAISPRISSVSSFRVVFRPYAILRLHVERCDQALFRYRQRGDAGLVLPLERYEHPAERRAPSSGDEHPTSVAPAPIAAPVPSAPVTNPGARARDGLSVTSASAPGRPASTFSDSPAELRPSACRRVAVSR